MTPRSWKAGFPKATTPQVEDPVIAPERVWLDAWLVVARAENCRKPEDATRWADECIVACAARFGERSQQ